MANTYSILIRRYGRYQAFENLEDLRDELRRYFTRSEIAAGVVERLTDFSSRSENSYHDIAVCKNH